MTPDPLRALAWLLVLGLLTTALTLATDALPPLALSAAVLAVACAKAEVILARYLALAAAPPWLAGFRAGVRLLALALMAAWAVPRLL